jgi:two-component system, cell cycle sensor histidine kinase and response regulator CckA
MRAHIQPGSQFERLLPLPAARHYVAALLLVSLAFLIRSTLSPVIEHPSPSLLCGLAVLAAAFYGGKGPGLFATIAGSLAGWYFNVQPKLVAKSFDGTDAVQLSSFLLIGIGATLFSDRLRSAKRHAERVAARNQEILEKYEYNLVAANVGTFDWNMVTGEVIWSDNMEAIHGQPPKTFDGTMDGVLKFILPDDHEMLWRKIQLAIAGDGNYQVECRHVREDGSVGWVEGKGRVIYAEGTRKPIRLTGVCINATERKRHEQAVLRLAEIVDCSDDAIISADLNGAILTWNAAAARMYGYSAEEAIGSDVTLLFSSGCASRKAEILQKLSHGERVDHFEALCLHKSGQPIWVSLTVSPVGGNSSTPTASFIARDITERKGLEEQLRQTAKLESLGVLAGGIAHDFNNLLVGILGNASLVRDALPAVSQARPMLDDVVRASERAANLTRQLLAYSGKGKFVIQPVDLSNLARDMVSLIQSSIPRTVRLQLDLATDLPPVTADVAQMQQLIMNLVINAAEAIGDRPGAVTVTTSLEHFDEQSSRAFRSSDELKPGEYVSLEVQDNGSGMDEATIAKIFDPFFTTKFTGRGLGLSATLGIVRGHQGAIRVDSQPGEGSLFTVLLPAAQAKMPAVTAPEISQADLKGAGAVLVVDDEEMVRRAAVVALEHCGYTVITASNGKIATDLFKKFSGRIVLVILDLSMPVMNGEECLRALKNIEPDVPVILSSGFSESDTIQRFREHTFSGFLQKPYTSGRLAEMAKVALSSVPRKASQTSA